MIAASKPLYDQDGIQLYCGDSYAILAGMGVSSVDAVLTDPPYGIAVVSRVGTIGGRNAAPVRQYRKVVGDDQPFDPAFLLKFGSRQIIWGADHFYEKLPSGGRFLVWDKRVGINSNNFADAEIAWDRAGGSARVFHHRQAGMLHDGFGVKGDTVARKHPTQKPLAAMSWCLELLAAKQSPRCMLDPFAGVGTTLVAARDRGIAAIGIEIDREYCEIAIARLRQRVLF